MTRRQRQLRRELKVNCAPVLRGPTAIMWLAPPFFDSHLNRLALDVLHGWPAKRPAEHPGQAASHSTTQA
jgi:hypothetical protein